MVEVKILRTLFVRGRSLAGMVEWTGAQDKVGVESEGSHPVCVVFEDVDRFAL